MTKHIILEKWDNGKITNTGELNIKDNSFSDELIGDKDEDLEALYIHPVGQGLEQAPKWVKKELGYNEKVGKDAEKIERANMFLEDAKLRTEGNEVNTFDLETAKEESSAALNILKEVEANYNG